MAGDHPHEHTATPADQAESVSTLGPPELLEALDIAGDDVPTATDVGKPMQEPEPSIGDPERLPDA